MCLAASAIADVRDVDEDSGGMGVCTAWLRNQKPLHPEKALAPPVGPAAATAEAFVAAARLDRIRGDEGWNLAQSMAYGELMMAGLYQPEDAPLLGIPERLIGAFRDRPHELDVQVDAVQHAACALLGIEELLRGEAIPGAMP